MGEWDVQKALVAQAARELARLGLVGRASGNLSVRLPTPELLVAITPTRRPHATLEAHDICVVDAEGVQRDGAHAPSSEFLLHLSLYRARAEINAVVHSHPVHATACAVAGLQVPPLVDELVVLVGGAIRVSDYALPGSADLGAQACAALRERKAALLRNHGLVTVGSDMDEAVELTELVERAAQVFFLSRTLGRAKALAPEVVEAEERLYRERNDLPPAAEEAGSDPGSLDGQG